MLRLPCEGNFLWLHADSRQPRAQLGFRFDGLELELEFTLDGEDRLQHVQVQSTPCHFGGERQWFACPSCQKRVGILYLRRPGFACRECSRISYQSQSADVFARVWLRESKIERRLGPNLSRPKGMHIRTHERLRREAIRLMIWRHEGIDMEAERRRGAQ